MPKRCKYRSRSSTPHYKCQTEFTTSPSTPRKELNNKHRSSVEDKLGFLISTKRDLEKELDEDMINLTKVKQKIYALEAKAEKLITSHVCDDSKHRMKKEIKFIKEEKLKVLEELTSIEDELTEKMLMLKKC